MSDAQVHENGVHPSTQENKVEEAGHKVFAGNLAYTTTDDGLRAFFAPVASDILSAQVIMRGSRSAGYGFVSLSTLDAAHKAVESLDKQDLDGRAVIVEIAKPSEQKDRDRKERKAKRRPGRRGSKAVPGEISEAEANGEVDKSAADAPAGTDDAAKPKKKKKNNRKKKAAAAAAAGDAPATDDAAPEGAVAEDAPKKAPRVRKPREPRPPRAPRAEGEDPVGEPSKTVVFVANLGFNVDDAALSALFTEAGINVVSARVARRRWGQPRKSKGFGFVDVGDEAEQSKAIAALEGKELDGRVIAVKVAVNAPRDEGDNDATTDAPAPDAPAPEAPVVAV